MDLAFNESTSVNLELIKNLILKHEEIEIAWLYGSRAKNCFREDSDWDLALCFNDKLAVYQKKDDFYTELLAQEWIEKLGLRDKDISVVNLNQAPLLLAWQVLSTGIVLCCRSDLRLNQERQRVSSMYEFYKIEKNKRDLIHG